MRKVGAARFGVMAGVAAALTAFFLYVAGVISEPAKSILYAGLEPRDAAQVTAKLDAMNIPYEAKGDGGTILVPANQVTKLRMELASENLPAAGVGYEIFDKSDAFGTTAFVQNINRLRALEGELARSVATIEGVESARVHLVIPEREIFSREAQSPSASVVLKTRGVLERSQVEAIQHLVGAAVAGLEPKRVAIVDDKGNLLAGGDDKTGAEATASDEEQQTTQYEDRVRQRIEGIVSSIVGQGHVRVQVAADMNYNHVSETSETFDPDSKVVRSTSTTEQNANDSNNNGTTNNSTAVSVANQLPGGQQSTQSSNGSKSDSTRTEETTNYEISKTVRTSTLDGGQLKRLSVAVAVDGNSTGDKVVPRSREEMQKIEELVKSAIGYDKSRGDQVQVVNMAFARMDVASAPAASGPLLGLEGGDWLKIIEAAIVSVAAIIIGLFVVRPLMGRMFAPASGQPIQMGALAQGQAVAQLAAPGGAALTAPQGQIALSPSANRDGMIDIQRIEGQVRESSIRKVGEVVQAHPEEALAILRTWLHQPV
ncbi:MAG TPA: flagellar basal-body MS-ring/collar protein FliF [Rhizomicrobium sp.]|jgi:flagellar M-ring protein FliF